MTDSPKPLPRVAFLGLGIMGSGMAARLLAAGFPLTVYNRSPERAAPLAAKGARTADTPREAAENADILIAMLADDDASRAIWLGDHGALAGAKKGALLIESSTLTVDWIRQLADAAHNAGCELLDAPVTGSKPQANNGELLFLIGGAESAFARARPILTPMARDVVHLGPTGSGALLKLINNFLCGVQLVSLAEALGMIERSSLNAEQALTMLSTGTPGSPMIKTLAGRMSKRDYTPNFALSLMAKDMRYAIAEGDRLSLNLATAKTALDAMRQAIAAGHANQDLSALAELFRKK
ncbi:MAG TPA: NAD(P)-dependent oxidoreductase [Phycisphaerae bacterium]|nr:NAD(P)-dependent oxidoreductase [Phycisphaerae bacterium]